MKGRESFISKLKNKYKLTFTEYLFIRLYTKHFTSYVWTALSSVPSYNSINSINYWLILFISLNSYNHSVTITFKVTDIWSCYLTWLGLNAVKTQLYKMSLWQFIQAMTKLNYQLWSSVMKCLLKTRLWGQLETLVESYKGHEDKDSGVPRLLLLTALERSEKRKWHSLGKFLTQGTDKEQGRY